MFPRMSTEWHSAKVRLGLAFVLSVLFLLPVTSAYAAGSTQGGSVVPTGSDICVEGTVINHKEELLGDGRIVTASYNGLSIAAAVDEDGEFEFENGLEPGRWNFAIDVVKNGEEWEPVTPASFDVQLEYGQDDCYQIRFKLRRLITVIVVKIDENHNRLPEWEIRAVPGAGNKFAITHEATTNSSGEATFRLSEGNWVFHESTPEDDEDLAFSHVVPLDGSQELYVEAPGPYTIRFKNRLNLYGCIEVLKQDVPPNGSGDTPFPLQGWDIELQRADGSIAASGRTDARGKIEFKDLPFGPYTVVEETRVGWSSYTASSFDVDVNPVLNSCVKVSFDNQQSDPEYCIEGRKIDLNGKVGLPGWIISAEPVDDSDVDPGDILTDGLGMYKFTFSGNDYRVPGSKYQICEDEDDFEGWEARSHTCYTVTLPTSPGSCTEVPDFINAQVGHPGTYTSSSSSNSSSNSSSSSGSCRKTHVVVRGDNLYKISNKYGTTLTTVVNANSWVRKTRNFTIHVGQKICIP